MTHSYSAPSEEIHKCKWRCEETKALQWLQDTTQTWTSRPGERIAEWRKPPCWFSYSGAFLLVVARLWMQILQKEMSIPLASATRLVLCLSLALTPSEAAWIKMRWLNVNGFMWLEMTQCPQTSGTKADVTDCRQENTKTHTSLRTFDREEKKNGF